MIGTALNYIRQRLDDHLHAEQGPDSEPETEERVVFLEGDKLDPLTLPQRRISMLVVNVQEDREFRDADRFQRRHNNGHAGGYERHYPDIHLELAILFIANFKDYSTAWNQLTQLLFFFQQHPVFDRESDKDLPPSIERLTNELRSQSFQEQNELWGALRTALRPAILLRFRLITLRGEVVAKPAPIKAMRWVMKRKVRLLVKRKPWRVKQQEDTGNLRSPPIP